MFNITEQDHDDFVALYINGDIYLGECAVKKALEHGTVDGIIRRCVFKLMAILDLSPKWAEYAEYLTLFSWKEFQEFLCK